ncbi:MAG: hypothetical protein IJT41_11200 [Clostridia bacterium]|nr:hypothetical protein [Clostridia bacterium]
MTKKILAVLMAAVMMLGMFALAAFAEDEKPAYTPVEYKIEDLVAAVENGEDVFLNPTDIIVLPVKEQSEPEDPVEGVAEAPAADENAISGVLIVEYLPGQDAASGNGNTRFVDYDGTGYAVKGLDDYTDYAYKETERRENYAIDYANANEYPFEQWKIESIYSGKEFNRIVLAAQWEEPVLTGWAGFTAMFRGYVKTVIDYIIQFLQDWFTQLGLFIAGN